MQNSALGARCQSPRLEYPLCAQNSITNSPTDGQSTMNYLTTFHSVAKALFALPKPLA